MGTYTKADYLIFSGRIENDDGPYAAFEVVDGETHETKDVPHVNIGLAVMREAREYLLTWLQSDPSYVHHQIGQLDLANKVLRAAESRRIEPLMTRLGLRLEILGL